MTRPGTALENPETGERIEFRETAAETGGDRVTFDYVLRPSGFGLGKVDHRHPRQTEQIEVRSGRLGVRTDGDEWTATPGTRFAVPPGTAHTVWNDGDEEMHAVVTLSPALDVETFFETTFGLAAAGRATRIGLPGPLQFAVLADAYREEFAVAGLPLSVQRPLATVLGALGRARGYRAAYPVVEEREPADA
ncbi:cupin domain-containing protein [Halosimplex aquaticum]|uniref:Cupin domain-containing protein n=1 Tax=Halosimplex aquaticum TaxID=3026162 RepID=A0ABD5Y452_9EURY|nr:cupin domain-containing protein [Halosimplex aquaticum]